MSAVEVPEIDERALVGFRCVKPVLKLLAHLHDTATERDRAGNRQWHMDQHIALLLLFMFNPICDSLRALQRASRLKKYSGCWVCLAHRSAAYRKPIGSSTRSY